MPWARSSSIRASAPRPSRRARIHSAARARRRRPTGGRRRPGARRWRGGGLGVGRHSTRQGTDRPAHRLSGYPAAHMAADPDCLFCKIVSGEIPSTRIAEDDRTVTFMDINPATRGHVLVVPREHAHGPALDRPRGPRRRSPRPRQRIAATMPERLGADGVNLLNSCGRAAWQTVFHFHLHVIPRYEADPLRLPWTPEPGDRDADRRGRARPRGLSVQRLALAALALALVPAAHALGAGRGDRADLPAGRQEGRARAARRRPRGDEHADGRLAARGADDAQGVGDRRPRRARLAVPEALRQGASPTARCPSTSCARRRRREGEALVGRVLRNRANGLPRTVGEAPSAARARGPSTSASTPA